MFSSLKVMVQHGGGVGQVRVEYAKREMQVIHLLTFFR